MSLVGKWSECELGDERREEADGDDETEPCLLDAVRVAPIVEHREHHAVTRGEQSDRNLQDKYESGLEHPATLGVGASIAP